MYATMIISKLSNLVKTRRIIAFTRQNSDYRNTKKPVNLSKRYEKLQKQAFRLKLQNKQAKVPTSSAYLQVLGHGSRGDARSIALCTDTTNYVFNCGEGLQRLANEHHHKLSRLEHVFVTRPTWTNMGGLPGVALTVRELGLKSIVLHGPKDSIGIIEATQNFMLLNNFKVHAADTSKSFIDPVINIDYVLLQRPNSLTENNNNGNSTIVIENFHFYAYELNGVPLAPHKKRKILNCKSETEDLMIYICRITGKKSIDLQKCIDLEVNTEPLIKELNEGNDVTLPDGRVVQYRDVITWDNPIFIVSECPDEKWIPLIVKNPAFIKYQQNSINKDNDVHTVVHFTPENILNNPMYKNWMHKFGPNTLHLIINEENTGYCSEALHKMQHNLHLIHPTIFPFFENKQNFADDQSLNESALDKKILEGPQQNTELSSKTKKIENLDLNFLQEGLQVRRCKTLDLIHLRPDRGLNTKSNVQIYPKQYIQELMNVDGFVDTLADLQTEINVKTKELGNNTEEYPKVLMLGTGSSVPNKVRNTSSILFQVDKDKSILLDCGESTFRQLLTFFGTSEIDKILQSIKIIYISHLHADHHLGLIGLLKQRKRVTSEPVFLLAPQQINSYLCYYHRRFDPITDQFRLISNRDILLNQPILSNTLLDELCETINVRNICTTFVTHCSFAYGIAVTLKDGRKICYSGDTMPCDKLVQLARNSFLLIHEATMEDSMEKEASCKRHSTFSQAVNIGVKAEANFTLLTHFSQRYSKLPYLPDKKRSNIDFNRIGIAYDFMAISLYQLPLLPLFLDPLKIMFREYDIKHRDRALRRDMAKELALKSQFN